jgi:hypothetical protein
MTRIKRIYADFSPSSQFGFIRVNPLKSDLIRVPLHFIFTCLVLALLAQVEVEGGEKAIQLPVFPPLFP